MGSSKPSSIYFLPLALNPLPLNPFTDPHPSFYSYELSKRTLTSPTDTHTTSALKVLLCGGLAGVATWVSIFPLDVIKTRVQTWDLHHSHSSPASQPLLRTSKAITKRPSTLAIAKAAYHAEGTRVFFRGLGICSARAFIVNAVQWAVYEWMMRVLSTGSSSQP